jgi:hypothetical protein
MWWRTDLPPRNLTSFESGSGTTNSIIGNQVEKATAQSKAGTGPQTSGSLSLSRSRHRYSAMLTDLTTIPT